MGKPIRESTPLCSFWLNLESFVSNPQAKLLKTRWPSPKSYPRIFPNNTFGKLANQGLIMEKGPGSAQSL